MPWFITCRCQVPTLMPPVPVRSPNHVLGYAPGRRDALHLGDRTGRDGSCSPAGMDGRWNSACRAGRRPGCPPGVRAAWVSIAALLSGYSWQLRWLGDMLIGLLFFMAWGS
jgi:hypothetical protein